MLGNKNEWVAVMTYPGSEMAVAKRFEIDDDPNGQKPIEYYLPMLANRDKRFKGNTLPEKPCSHAIFSHT